MFIGCSQAKQIEVALDKDIIKVNQIQIGYGGILYFTNNNHLIIFGDEDKPSYVLKPKIMFETYNLPVSIKKVPV